MKLWNIKICLTSRISLVIMTIIFCSTLVLASVWSREIEKPTLILEDGKEEKAWIPTAEDIAYQDSMYQIIRSTQNDITSIKEDMVLILERLDYEDGSWDSIRYVKGGRIDRNRNKSN